MDVDVITTALNAMSYEERGEYLKKGSALTVDNLDMFLKTVPSRRRTLDIPTIVPSTSETTIALLLRDPTIKHLPRGTTIHSETRTRSRNQGHKKSTR